MGRKRNVFVRDFYKFNVETDEYTCKVCSEKLKGSYVTNLRRHLKRKHIDIYNRESDEFSEKRKKESLEKIKFYVRYSKEEINNACIDLITAEALPLSFLDSKAFKCFATPIFEGLNMPRINSHNIMNIINEKFLVIKSNIRRIIKNKIISLKLDIASRHDRSILAINLQIIHNNEIQIFSLSFKELLRRHNAENLRKEIEDVLLDFDIKKKQIYSITTDNGRNLLKAVDLLDEEEQEIDDDNSETIQAWAENCTRHILSVHCAAHTLQLAANDFLKGHEDILNKARNLVKLLRTPTMRFSLIQLNLRKPTLDVVTRWNSTFLMLKNLLEHKTFCLENTTDLLSEPDWEEIEEIHTLLGPLYTATLQLQDAQLCLGDFYKFWLSLKVKLQTLISPKSQLMKECLEKREPTLLENPAITAALFLDPRLRRLLSPEKKIEAKRHLKNLAACMLQLKNKQGTSTEGTSTEGTSTSLISEDCFSETESESSTLQDAIKAMEVYNSSDEENPPIDDELLQIHHQIENYKEKRVDIESSLLDYWESKKYQYPFLRSLAYVVHAVPATQVSVERCFSAMKYILDDRRTRLSSETLNTILFVKLNNYKI